MSDCFNDEEQKKAFKDFLGIDMDELFNQSVGKDFNQQPDFVKQQKINAADKLKQERRSRLARKITNILANFLDDLTPIEEKILFNFLEKLQK